MKIVCNYNTPEFKTQSPIYPGNYQALPYQKTLKVTEFFEYLYTYPPKVLIKWDGLDELTQDLFLEHNYGVLEHSFPFIDYVEDFFFKSLPQKAVKDTALSQSFRDGFLNKVFSSNFYNKETKEIQLALSPIPVYVILNGHKEIVLSKPINPARSNVSTQIVNRAVYDFCGAFDHSIEASTQLGFFFLNYSDAEVYLEEIAKADIDGTKTVGLSINCIGLNSAYCITREHHPNVDFRFVPNYKEVQDLLKNKLSDSKLIVDDEQQQLRFRPRNLNMLPFLGKAGRLTTPLRSFLQNKEQFKGVPIYIVQIRNGSRNIAVEQYFNLMNKLDTSWSHVLQFYDALFGFGDNWLMQGSLKEASKSNKFSNYIFFKESDAKKFIKSHGRDVVRYTGSRTSNLESFIRKPKIFVYNLEDFLEDWEEKLLNNFNGQDGNAILNAKETFFVPDINVEEFDSLTKGKTEILKVAKETLGLRYRLFKRYVGFLFSVGYA